MYSLVLCPSHKPHPVRTISSILSQNKAKARPRRYQRCLSILPSVKAGVYTIDIGRNVLPVTCFWHAACNHFIMTSFPISVFGLFPFSATVPSSRKASSAIFCFAAGMLWTLNRCLDFTPSAHPLLKKSSSLSHMSFSSVLNAGLSKGWGGEIAEWVRERLLPAASLPWSA